MNTCCIDESYKHNVEYTMLSQRKQTSKTICCWIPLQVGARNWMGKNQENNCLGWWKCYVLNFALDVVIYVINLSKPLKLNTYDICILLYVYLYKKEANEMSLCIIMAEIKNKTHMMTLSVEGVMDAWKHPGSACFKVDWHTQFGNQRWRSMNICYSISIPRYIPKRNE